MKVSCVQFDVHWGDPARNLEDMERLCPDHSDLVVFPELATTGYFFTERAQVEELAESASGSSCQFLINLAKKNKCHIVWGFPEKEGSQLYNSSAIVNEHGLVDVYRKTHLFNLENRLFDPGNTPFHLVKINGVNVGQMICFDWVFPESARSLALLGADVICHPSNLVLPYCPDAMITRCLENKVFIATCNRIGVETNGQKQFRYIGRSQIVNPVGERLAALSETEEGTITVEVDVQQSRQKMWTAFNHVFTDRRPDHYTVAPEKEGSDKPFRPNVAMIAVDKNGLVLVGERADAPGVWQIPQGGIDSGETKKQAALREFREEIGTENIHILAQSDKTYRYEFPEWLQHTRIASKWKGQEQTYFVVRIADGETLDVGQADGEFIRFNWMAPNELIDQIVLFKRRVYIEAFADLARWIYPKKTS